MSGPKLLWATAWVLLGLAAGTLHGTVAEAASQNECAIWLCLPAGFPGGACAAPHHAMIRRVERFQPPLPPFTSCAVSAPVAASGSRSGVMSFRDGIAAEIPTHRECTSTRRFGQGSSCARWITVPHHYVRGRSCQRGLNHANPPYCTNTVHYVQVMGARRQAVGSTYYFRY